MTPKSKADTASHASAPSHPGVDIDSSDDDMNVIPSQKALPPDFEEKLRKYRPNLLVSLRSHYLNRLNKPPPPEHQNDYMWLMHQTEMVGACYSHYLDVIKEKHDSPPLPQVQKPPTSSSVLGSRISVGLDGSYAETDLTTTIRKGENESSGLFPETVREGVEEHFGETTTNNKVAQPEEEEEEEGEDSEEDDTEAEDEETKKEDKEQKAAYLAEAQRLFEERFGFLPQGPQSTNHDWVNSRARAALKEWQRKYCDVMGKKPSGSMCKDIKWLKKRIYETAKAKKAAKKLEASMEKNNGKSGRVYVQSEDGNSWIPCSLTRGERGRYIAFFDDGSQDPNIDVYRTLWRFEGDLPEDTKNVVQSPSVLKGKEKAVKMTNGRGKMPRMRPPPGEKFEKGDHAMVSFNGKRVPGKVVRPKGPWLTVRLEDGSELKRRPKQLSFVKRDVDLKKAAKGAPKALPPAPFPTKAPAAAPPPPSRLKSSSSPKQSKIRSKKYKVGTQVKFDGKAGVITAINNRGWLHVQIEDNLVKCRRAQLEIVQSSTAPSQAVPLPPPKAKPVPWNKRPVFLPQVGDKLDVYWPLDEIWYPCNVVREASDGALEVVYDDGTEEVVHFGAKQEIWRPQDISGLDVYVVSAHEFGRVTSGPKQGWYEVNLRSGGNRRFRKHDFHFGLKALPKLGQRVLILGNENTSFGKMTLVTNKGQSLSQIELEDTGDKMYFANHSFIILDEVSTLTRSKHEFLPQKIRVKKAVKAKKQLEATSDAKKSRSSTVAKARPVSGTPPPPAPPLTAQQEKPKEGDKVTCTYAAGKSGRGTVVSFPRGWVAIQLDSGGEIVKARHKHVEVVKSRVESKEKVAVHVVSAAKSASSVSPRKRTTGKKSVARKVFDDNVNESRSRARVAETGVLIPRRSPGNGSELKPASNAASESPVPEKPISPIPQKIPEAYKRRLHRMRTVLGGMFMDRTSVRPFPPTGLLTLSKRKQEELDVFLFAKPFESRLPKRRSLSEENELEHFLEQNVARMKMHAHGLKSLKRREENLLEQFNTTDTQLKEERSERRQRETAGKRWFNMQAGEHSLEDRNDLQTIVNRNYMDPKRFYKKDDSNGNLPKFYQIGTVMAGLGEKTMSRREQSRTVMAEHFAGDERIRKYVKRGFNQVQEKRNSGGKIDYQKRTQKKRKRR